MNDERAASLCCAGLCYVYCSRVGLYCNVLCCIVLNSDTPHRRKSERGLCVPIEAVNPIVALSHA